MRLLAAFALLLACGGPQINVAPEVQTRMINNDFTWAANNRTRIITEWRKRYDVKSEPKK